MAAIISKVKVEGMQGLVTAVAVPKLTKEIVAGIRSIANDLHTEVAKGVKQRYATQQSLNSVLIGNGAGIRIAGNVIKATLAYRYEGLDLSRFPYEPKIVQYSYATHSVEVIRGQSKIVNGKSGNGGFVPKGATKRKRGSGSRPWKKVKRMYERVGRTRLPLRVLFGPSLSQQAQNVLFNNPTPAITNITENFDSILANKITL
jgi:hypothetical protein